ncbi:MAG: hypothetical protein AB1585_06820 [Thermodesulfobacteriota bacterium]
MRKVLEAIIILCLLNAVIGTIGTVLFPFSAWGDQENPPLNLTPAQAQAINALRREFQREEIQTRQKIMLRRMELRTLTPEERQGEKGEALKNEIRSLMLHSRERSVYYRQEALKMLSPEQQQMLPPESAFGFHCRSRFHRRGGWETPRMDQYDPRSTGPR